MAKIHESHDTKYTKLADYYTQLLGGNKDRVTLKELEPGVYSHFDVEETEDAVEYFNLDFTPRKFEYFDMYANWFQVSWQRVRDGRDTFKCLFDGKSGPNIDCWRDPIKLSTFAGEKADLMYLTLPMDLLRRRMIHYTHWLDKYAAPVDHVYMKPEIPIDQVKLSRTAFKIVLIADQDVKGEEALKQYQKEHGCTLCAQFSNFVCTYVVKDGEVYYRPLTRDYYVRVKPEYKQYYQGRPILQVLDSLTGLVYTEKSDQILCRFDKKKFKRWLDRGIDGCFLITIPSRPHIPVDEMFFVVLTHYPSSKKLEEARPIR